MVTQDVQFFRASVRDNLTFFDPAIDRRRDPARSAELIGEWLQALGGLDALAAGGGGTVGR